MCVWGGGGGGKVGVSVFSENTITVFFFLLIFLETVLIYILNGRDPHLIIEMLTHLTMILSSLN